MRNSIKIFLTIIGFFLIWELSVILLKVPNYILPRPSTIFLTTYNNLSIILYHTWWTSYEIVIGFLIAVLAAIFISVFAIYSKYVDTVIHPILVVVQVIPKVAIAPLMLIWMGYGLGPKIIVAALTCFFPIVIGLKKGLDSTDQQMIDTMRSIGSSRWQILTKVQFPFSLPQFFSGLKVGISLAAVGAIIAEFVNATKGLGYYISYSASFVDTPEVFAGIFLTVIIGIMLYAVIALLEKKIVFWEKERIFN